jgi:hypothetical protein
LKTGAPKSFDGSKALEIDLLRKKGQPNVEIARHLGCKIIKDDYFKDIAPRVFYKHKKLGKEIDSKLDALYSYLVDPKSTKGD